MQRWTVLCSSSGGSAAWAGGDKGAGGEGAVGAVPCCRMIDWVCSGDSERVEGGEDEASERVAEGDEDGEGERVDTVDKSSRAAASARGGGDDGELRPLGT